MRHVLLMLAVGAVAALGLFELLNAVEHPVSEPEDPWRDAWIASGLDVPPRVVSHAPKGHLMFKDGCERVKGPEFENTSLQRYLIEKVNVQVVVFPRAGLAPEFPEGRHDQFRLKPKGGSIYLCRLGRKLLLIRQRTNGIFFVEEEGPTPKALIDRLCDIFEETAARYP